MLVTNCEYRYIPKVKSLIYNLEEPKIQTVDEYTIHYIIEGDGVLRINKNKFPLRHNSLFVTFPTDSYSFILSKYDISFTYYIVSFQLAPDDKDLSDLMVNTIKKKRTYYLQQHKRGFFHEIYHNFLSGSPYLMESCKYQVISLLYMLPGEKQEYTATAQSLEYIEKAIDVMHAKINDRTTLEQICEQLNISVHHFIRIFKMHQGVPPMKYCMRLKIDAAANMLIETNSPVYEIAEALNFNNPPHFCRTFKKYLGSSPTTYRNSQIQYYEAKKRKYRKDLEEAYILLQTIIDATPDLVFFKDVHSVYMGCNEAFCKFTGLTKDKIIGRSDFDIHSQEKAKFFTNRDKLVFEHDRIFMNEETLTFPNGQNRLYHVIKAPFHNSSGDVIGLIGISRDISKLKH